MKFSKKLALLTLTTAGVIGLVGCKSNAKMPVSFVAVTSSDYNAEIQFGDYDYKFQGKINQGSNAFTLAGNVTQRHMDSGERRMGPPSGGDEAAPEFVGFGPEEGGGAGGGGAGGGGMGGFGGGDFGGGDFGGGGGPGGPGEGGDSGEKAAIQSMSLSFAKNEVFVRETIKGNLAFTPENVDESVTWESSDEKIATVADGTVTPLAVGQVTVTATSVANPTKSASATLTIKEENLRQYDWSVKGTYVYEKGYGYKITFDDEGKTVVHTDFDKTEGRHEFYYNVKIGETSSVIKFQAKDPTFKDSLAKDYKKWDERDAQYTFYAKATGNNSSLATAYMYLHKTNNEVTVNTPNGENRSLNFGMKWEQRGEQIVVKDGEKEYVSDKSTNPDHPGYRLVYGGNAYYLSLNENVKWKKLTMEDFDGQTTHEFAGSYSAGMFGGNKEVNLNLGADGVSRLYIGTPAPSFKGTWTKDATTGEVSVTIGEHTAKFTKGADDKLSIVVRIQVESNNPFSGGKSIETKYVTVSQVK